MLRFGVISAYPHEDLTSQRIAGACRLHGRVVVLRPTELAVRVDGGKPGIYARGRDVREFDAVLTPRVVGEHGDPDFHCATMESIADLGVPVLNHVPALLVARDKIRSGWLLDRAGIPTPMAVAVQTLSEARQALDELGCAVAKPPYGSLGIGILLLKASDRDAKQVLADLLQEHGLVYLQRLARGRRPGRDLRLFVVGDKVAAAIERSAPPGELVTNVANGGKVRARSIDDAVERMAVAATRALSLEYSGVDVIESEDGPVVLEVNGTPRFEGILEATGHDMAHEIAARARQLAEARGKPEEESWTVKTTRSPSRKKLRAGPRRRRES
jgi:RimK family alpha-L-glutamate ligase